jgi:hypothetical protein
VPTVVVALVGDWRIRAYQYARADDHPAWGERMLADAMLPHKSRGDDEIGRARQRQFGAEQKALSLGVQPVLY